VPVIPVASTTRRIQCAGLFLCEAISGIIHAHRDEFVPQGSQRLSHDDLQLICFALIFIGSIPAAWTMIQSDL
jgi:hypothetical protein